MRVLVAAMVATGFALGSAPSVAQTRVEAAPSAFPDLDDARRARLKMAGIAGASAVGVYLYGKKKWWGDGFTDDFKTENEGWFGQSTYAGGADKLGHFYGNYLSTRLLARTFEWVGNDERTSLVFAAGTVLTVFTGIEVLDGLSKEWEFSKEDQIANMVGVGTAFVLERYPALDRLLDIRLHYVPDRSRDFDPFGDYSGQTYLLVAKASGVPALRSHSWLRYFELAAGYGVRRLEGPVENRERNLYFGVSLNLSELLNDTAFRDTPPSSWSRRLTTGFLEVVQVPGTVVAAKHRF
jgi:hypothetical protein